MGFHVSPVCELGELGLWELAFGVISGVVLDGVVGWIYGGFMSVLKALLSVMHV